MDNSVNCITPFSELSFREFGTKYDMITRILYKIALFKALEIYLSMNILR